MIASPAMAVPASPSAGPAARWYVRLRDLTGWRADGTGVLAGAAAALALPPFFCIPVLLLSFPTLMALIGGAANRRVAFRRGFWFGFGLNVAGLYWITEAILLEAARYWWFVPIAVPGLSALMALFIAAACAFAKGFLRGLPRLLAFAAAWTVMDLLRQFLLTGFPWNPLASIWAIPGLAGDIMLQPVAWIGTPGVTALTVFLACLPVLRPFAWGVGACAMVVWAALGWMHLSEHPDRASALNVVLVQGNIPQGQKFDRRFLRTTWDTYLRLTHEGVEAAHKAMPGDPVVVVWPETASVALLADDAAARQSIAEAAEGNPTLIGSVRFGEDGRPRNSLIAMDGQGGVQDFYDKWHLVPGGEFAPGWLPFAVQLVPGGGFVPGPGPRTLDLPGLPPFAPLICYEAIFPAQIVNEIQRPAWIVNITNDAWFGQSTGPHQHLAAVRMRAVEEGLPIMRAANTGITVGYDAYGHQVARMNQGQAGFLLVRLPGPLAPTFFSRYGLIVPALLTIMLLLAAIICGRHKIRAWPL
ncbi:Apolipoprotein N-acyltransferase [Granulibacter bethesdensis]|nr:Apolipoprotein N-acyltransferase [Granulibacter bethesdensis]